MDTLADRLVDPYHPEANATTFDLDGWLQAIQWDAVRASAEYRRVVTRLDPLLFAYIYLRHHLKDADGRVTFGDCHLEWYRLMREWAYVPPELRGWRHSFASPRDSGKSTSWYTIAPIWGGAHGHVRFVAAFADSGTQAEMHLQTFRTEAQHNPLLRNDFPDLCVPTRKPTGKTVADNEGMYHSRGGFVFAARGADTASLGMKVGTRRPDVLILDDIEKDESKYSAGMAEKRLGTVLDAILPLNERARVVIVGTVTRPGSIIHQLVRHARGLSDPNDPKTSWIADQNITAHHHPPIVTNPDGTRRSIWPARWDLAYLDRIAHTRSYAKNFDNNPKVYDGTFWTDQDYRYGTPDGRQVTRWFLWVDPPTTTKTSSDPAGVAIIGYYPAVPPDPHHPDRPAHPDPAVVVWHAEDARLTGRRLGAHLVGLITRFHHDTGRVIVSVMVEANQGGDLWHDVFDSLPVPVHTYTVSEPKPVRIADALNLYQVGQVWHARELPRLEEQQLAYPAVDHDDVVDVVSSAARRLLRPPPPPKRSRTIHQR